VSATDVTSAVAAATIPTTVKAEGAKAERAYRVALEFEAELLQQMLTQALPEASETGAEGGEGGEAFGAGGDPSLTTLPETVAHTIIGAGGLGMAKELYRSIEGQSAAGGAS
jgi:hypothetical protein